MLTGSLSSLKFILPFWSFWESPALKEGRRCGYGTEMDGQVFGESILLVQAHGWALVHAHVRIAQQASGLALNAFGIQGMQLLWGHF